MINLLSSLGSRVTPAEESDSESEESEDPLGNSRNKIQGKGGGDEGVLLESVIIWVFRDYSPTPLIVRRRKRRG